MKFLVVGCGSIGTRHIKNLLAIAAGEVIACDTNESRRQTLAREYNIQTYSSFTEALELEPGITAVWVCTPTRLHIPVALSAARKGRHLFIEKPLSDTMEGIDELAEMVQRRELVATVGFNMRLSPAVKLVKELLDAGRIGRVLSARASWGFYLPYWHPGEDYRRGYTANSSLGGGIILDCVHELDYLRWFLGGVREVSCFSGKVSSLEMDTEDLAEILLRFESGVIAGVHFDCLQHTYRRSCELIGEAGIIVADLIEQNVKLFSDREKLWQTLYDNKTDVNQTYIEETKHFITCIEGRDAPMVDLASAKRVLQIALAAKESARSGGVVSL